MQYATTNTHLEVQSIVNELDPAKKVNRILGHILTTLTAGLAFIPGVGEGALAIDAATVSAGNALVAALQQAPGVFKT